MKHTVRLLLLSFALLPLCAAAQKVDTTLLRQWQDKFRFTTVRDNPATSVKDQARSGTCWAYAGISFVESEMLRAGKKPVDLAEMYVVYCAYLEKARKYVRMHGASTFSPGGEGNDVLDVIRRYGIVPQEVYPGLVPGETFNNHSELDRALLDYVKGVVSSKTIRGDWESGLKGILDRYLGTLPGEFTYQGKKYTPRTFADKVVGIRPDDYRYFTSWAYEPYYRNIHLLVPDNWSWQKYYNLPLDEMIGMLDYALENGYTVIWSADMSEKYFSVPLGLAVAPADETDTLMFDGPKAEKTVTEPMRQQAFDNYTTVDDHAMHLTGIARDGNGKKYYIVKNSWGTDVGFDGIYYVSEAYLRYKTISITVDKGGVPAPLLEKLK